MESFSGVLAVEDVPAPRPHECGEVECGKGAGIQELLGHESVETTMIYTHVLGRGGRGVLSPLDGVGGVWDDSEAN